MVQKKHKQSENTNYKWEKCFQHIWQKTYDYNIQKNSYKEPENLQIIMNMIFTNNKSKGQ